ncbi:reticulata-related protein 1, chloroplastic [Tanacetum coccineum]|uniref:Reticulata-related protein 1, chloroplastic n=1 Tax=Tanacetum coccineum TaxID=301880 RepID=A0ABQ4Y2T1_9ASTR
MALHSHLKLNNSSTLPIKNSFNFNPVIKLGNNNNVSLLSIHDSKFENTNSKIPPIVFKDEKPDRDSRGGDNSPPRNGGGSGGGGDGDDDDYEEKEFGRLLKLEQVMQETEERDMLGIREFILMRLFDSMGSGSSLELLTRNFPVFRNRTLADPSFLFKVGAEIVIESFYATFAEVQKRGKDFWDEFQLNAADLLVGTVVDVALVGMLAPYARSGKRSLASGGLFSGLKNSVAALPSSVFEFERPGCTFSAQQRPATYFYKGVLYGSVGFGCGLIGQGITNMIMNAKRNSGAKGLVADVASLFGFGTRESLWALGFLTTSCAMLLDKMLPDLQFLFEAGIEMVIDSCSATFAKIQKRVKDLWDEFKSSAAVFLAGMLVPYARTGNRSIASGLNNSVAALPSSDERYQRLTTYTHIYQVEQMSSFNNYTNPMATFSLGGTSQRDERVTMVREDEVRRLTIEAMRTRVLEFEV